MEWSCPLPITLVASHQACPKRLNRRPQLSLCTTFRSGVADYINFLTRLYDTIFHQKLPIDDHRLVIMIKMWSVGHEFKNNNLLILPPQTLMSWNGLASTHNGQGLDHCRVQLSIVFAFVPQQVLSIFAVMLTNLFPFRRKRGWQTFQEPARFFAG